MVHGLSYSATCEIFPAQGWILYLLHWQADSLPLSYQGSPGQLLFNILNISCAYFLSVPHSSLHACSIMSDSLQPHGLYIVFQATLSMPFPRQEQWRGLPFPPPRDLPNPGIKPEFPATPALQADSLPLHHLGSPSCI